MVQPVSWSTEWESRVVYHYKDKNVERPQAECSWKMEAQAVMTSAHDMMLFCHTFCKKYAGWYQQELP